MTEKGIISTYESGVDLVVEWKIGNFFNLPETDGTCYSSPAFSFSGVTWRLRISPNGSSGSDSSGHVNLSLWKYGFGRSIKQTFSLSLKTAKGEKYNEQNVTKDFEKGWGYHSFNRFLQRSDLTRRRYELVPDGVLTVVCTMMSSTSAGSAKCNITSELEDLGKSQWVTPYHVRAAQGKTDKQRHCWNCYFNNSMHDPEHAYMGASTQRVQASIQNVKESIQTVKASIQTVEASIQTVEPSIQTVEASTQTMEEKCEASATGSSTNFHENKLHHDFKELFLKKEDCDVTIKVEDSEFPAHRVILKARSPVFASTFRHNMKENATGIVEIEDCESSSFSDFLCFLYCGDASIISQENVFALFRAADKYQVLDLRAKCLEFIKENLTVDTFCETISLALRHSETKLIRLCTDYFKRNVPKIIVTAKWQTFLAENPTESNELLVKFFVTNSS